LFSPSKSVKNSTGTAPVTQQGYSWLGDWRATQDA
jgi:hypothetical protein